MKAEIKGGNLFIEIELQETTPSTNCKALVMANSQGKQTTTAMFDVQPIIIGLNAYS